MNTGTIKIADHQGVYVIRMAGDVRLTLCLAFDEYIESVLAKPDYSSVIFDLTHAHAIDSTTLGLMAKFSIKAGQHGKESPLVVSSNPSITRVLVSMGFDDIFRLVDESEIDLAKRDEGDVLIVAEKNGHESAVKRKVLEAHKYLMSMNDENLKTFQELVETLESGR